MAVHSHAVLLAAQRLGLHPSSNVLAEALNNQLQKAHSPADVEAAAHALLMQALFTDIRLMVDRTPHNACCLPAGIKSQPLLKLAGPCMLQVDELVDIGVAAAEREDANQAGSRRTLKLCVSDGLQTTAALEWRAVPEFNGLRAGAKIVVRNVEVRRGLLLLSPANCKVLGGYVPALASLQQSVAAAAAAAAQLPSSQSIGASSRALEDHSRSSASASNAAGVPAVNSTVNSGSGSSRGAVPTKIAAAVREPEVVELLDDDDDNEGSINSDENDAGPGESAAADEVMASASSSASSSALDVETNESSSGKVGVASSIPSGTAAADPIESTSASPTSSSSSSSSSAAATPLVASNSSAAPAPEFEHHFFSTLAQMPIEDLALLDGIRIRGRLSDLTPIDFGGVTSPDDILSRLATSAQFTDEEGSTVTVRLGAPLVLAWLQQHVADLTADRLFGIIKGPDKKARKAFSAIFMQALEALQDFAGVAVCAFAPSSNGAPTAEVAQQGFKVLVTGLEA